jgi:hypothetical protein
MKMNWGPPKSWGGLFNSSNQLDQSNHLAKQQQQQVLLGFVVVPFASLIIIMWQNASFC